MQYLWLIPIALFWFTTNLILERIATALQKLADNTESNDEEAERPADHPAAPMGRIAD